MRLIVAFVFMVLVAFPFTVLAQSPDSSFALPTSTAGVISLIVQTLVIPLIGLAGQALWGWIEKRKGRDALGRILELIDAVGQPVWDRMTVQVKLALADGVVSKEERETLLKALQEELQRLVSPTVLKLAMKALGVPDILGLTSWLLGRLLARWTAAHDDNDDSVPSSLTGVYPVPYGDVMTPAQKAAGAAGPAGLPPDAPEYGGG